MYKVQSIVMYMCDTPVGSIYRALSHSRYAKAISYVMRFRRTRQMGKSIMSPLSVLLRELNFSHGRQGYICRRLLLIWTHVRLKTWNLSRIWNTIKLWFDIDLFGTHVGRTNTIRVIALHAYSHYYTINGYLFENHQGLQTCKDLDVRAYKCKHII